MALAPKIDETITRTEAQRYQAISNAGYAACKSNRHTTGDNPYWDGDDGDAEAWNEGFLLRMDEENDC